MDQINIENYNILVKLNETLETINPDVINQLWMDAKAKALKVAKLEELIEYTEMQINQSKVILEFETLSLINFYKVDLTIANEDSNKATKLWFDAEVNAIEIILKVQKIYKELTNEKLIITI